MHSKFEKKILPFMITMEIMVIVKNVICPENLPFVKTYYLHLQSHLTLCMPTIQHLDFFHIINSKYTTCKFVFNFYNRGSAISARMLENTQKPHTCFYRAWLLGRRRADKQTDGRTD